MNYRCKQCGLEKADGDFYSDNRNAIKGIRANCKACVIQNNNAYKKKIGYTESDKERGRRWALANPEKCKEQARKRRENNRIGARAAVLRWIRNNPEHRIVYRLKVRSAMPAWAERYKMKAVYQKAKQLALDVDHIVPLISDLVCGLHCWHNLQLLEKCTNISKSNKVWPDMP